MPSTLCLPPFSTSRLPSTFQLSGKPKWTVVNSSRSISCRGVGGAGNSFLQNYNLFYQEDLQFQSLFTVLHFWAGNGFIAPGSLDKFRSGYAQSVCVCVSCGRCCVGMVRWGRRGWRRSWGPGLLRTPASDGGRGRYDGAVNPARGGRALWPLCRWSLCHWERSGHTLM